MKEQIEFMTKILENPYYPVDLEDYPKLFDFKITANGIIYLQRLEMELNSEKEITEDEYLYVSLLHLAYAVANKSVEECHNWQEFLATIGQKVNLDKPGIKETLGEMGCIIENPDYDPKLYKSHLVWKKKMLDAIDKVETRL